MGTEGGTEGGTSKQIDDTAGTLVWVRRRNGSWWPGRVMGLHELPEGSSVSPKLGTPVKLLGRDDASVEWYNLEKSKRVKAFRCGEYDKCIEKAKALATNTSKKPVRYARREDAILHALELENTCESDENHATLSNLDRSNPSRQGLRIKKPTSDSEDDDTASKETTSKANVKELSRSWLTFENKNDANIVQTDFFRRTADDSVNGGSEGTRRMRDPNGLEMRILSQRITNVLSDSEKFSNSEESVEFDHDKGVCEPNVCSSGSDGSPVSRSLSSSHVPPTHENLKRKKRCLPLKKVLESTPIVSLLVQDNQSVYPGQSSLQGVADSNVSAVQFTDSKKPKISVINYNGQSCHRKFSSDASLYNWDGGVETGHILSDPKDTDVSTIPKFPDLGNDDSAGLFGFPFTQEKKHTEGTHGNLQSPHHSREHYNHSKVGLDEFGSASDTVDTSSLYPVVGKYSSEWQSKGKRNLRTQSHKTNNQMALRRSVDRDSESDLSLNGKHHTDVFSQGFDCKAEPDTFYQSLDLKNSGPWSFQVSESTYLDPVNYGKKLNLSITDDIHQPKDRQLNLSLGKHVMAKPTMQVRNKELYIRDDSISPLVPHRSLPYRQSRFTPHSKYQDAYVPSKHILGNSLLFDVDLEVRATNPGRHVPLVSLMSKLNGKAIVGHPVTVEICEDGSSDILLNSTDHLAGSSDELYEVSEDVSDQSTEVAGISVFQSRYSETVEQRHTESGCGRRSAFHSKSSASRMKPPKPKKSCNLSRKTRKLSSLVALSQREPVRKPVVEKLGGPVITCVPLNIVFSRINEALSGPSRSTHHKPTLGNL